MTPGAILFHKEFVFRDGTAADKYLVVLAKTESILVVAKTTSKGHRYRNDHGCQAGNYFPAFLLTVGCCCLPLNTWICLDEFFELELNKVTSGVVRGNVRQYGFLTPDLTKDVQACAVSTDDISPYQEQQIRAHF
jgi:hypothetical protein